MTIVAADFTTAFPEFSNAATYPLSQINYWIPAAYGQLNATLFGTSIDLAVMLYVAHNIVLSARAARTAAAGGIGGDVSGPMSSKSVGPVSASYDVGLTTMKNGGPWNYTSYGQRLYKMMLGFTAGPNYVPAANVVPFPPYAYPGSGW